MRKFHNVLSITLVLLCAACSKDKPKEKDGDIPKVEDYQIWYQSTDGREIVPNTIEDFGANYLGSVYIDGYGLMYFDAPINAIPDAAFKDCTRLKSFAGSKKVKSVGSHAFDGCTNLSGVENLDNAEVIGDYAFYNCASLKGIGKVTSVTKMGNYAFCNSGVESVWFDADVLTDVGECVFMGCSKLNRLAIPTKISVIPRNFANGCESLLFVDLGNTVKEIKDSAFFNCSSMLNFVFGTGDIPKIDKDALSLNGYAGLMRVPFDMLSAYKQAIPEVADKMLPTSIPDDKVDQWCDYIPDGMPLLLMTVPGLHDAATWSVSRHDADIYLETIKDQEKTYDYAFSHGARMFDMRLGYNFYAHDYDDGCCFFHGDQSDVFCKLNTFREDIQNHFPTKEDVQKNFMILVVKDENIDLPTDEAKTGVFHHFMKYLEERYGKDMFVDYHPRLTYGDVKGKILLLVRTWCFIEINMCNDVFLNFLEDTQVTPYFNAQPHGPACPVTTQDVYETGSSDAKVETVIQAVKGHKPDMLTNMFINQLNATDRTTLLKKSWTISPGVNDYMHKSIESGVFDNYSLGMVYMDFYWQDVLEMESEADYTFNGEKCARALIKHNFRQMIKDFDPGHIGL